MKMMVMVMIMKNVVMALHTAVNGYNPTLFLFYRCHVFMSRKDNFTEIRSGLYISIFDILFANEVLYRSYVLRHHLLLSVLCS